MSGERFIWAHRSALSKRSTGNDLAVVVLAGLSAALPALAEPLQATTLRVFEAPDADQGVAVDDEHFYAIDNYVIAKHDKKTGKLIDRWNGGAGGPIRHLNSCIVHGAVLECANSNYPETPIASSIEYFDAAALEHSESHSLGLTDEGSLTWTDTVDRGRIAGFAHYDQRGGEPYKNSVYGAVVLFDDAWRRTGGYAFPPSVSKRMAPHAASGGAVGPDGLLYALGHDRPEMYVLGRPRMGPYLKHLATISLEAEGQAFSFEPGDQPIVWVIDRRAGLVRQIQLPRVATDHRYRFR